MWQPRSSTPSLDCTNQSSTSGLSEPADLRQAPDPCVEDRPPPPPQQEAMAEPTCCPFKEGGGGEAGEVGRAPLLFRTRPRDHLSLNSPRPFLEGRWRSGAADLPCGGGGAGARRMRTAGQVLGALTSWHSPLPLLAVTLYIRVTCPLRPEPLLQLPLPPSLLLPLPPPPPPGSSRPRHGGRCGRPPGPAAAISLLRPGAPPSAGEEPPSRLERAEERG